MIEINGRFLPISDIRMKAALRASKKKRLRKLFGADPARIIGFQQTLDWINSGTWNDLVPTSDEWTAAVSWLFNGIWDDTATTGDATWSSPDATAYSIWADTEATV